MSSKMIITETDAPALCESRKKGTQYTLLHSVKARVSGAFRGRATFYFPIWWYVAPTIVNTFLESCDLTGKTVVPFATSGGSGMGGTNKALAPSCTGARLVEGKVFRSSTNADTLREWVKTLK